MTIIRTSAIAAACFAAYALAHPIRAVRTWREVRAEEGEP